VANKRASFSDSGVPPLRDMDAPTGIDLYPEPPETVRVSKRAGLVALAVLCGLACLFAFGVYQRANRQAQASFAKDEPRSVAPATNAAQEIKKGIPETIIKPQVERSPDNDERSAVPVLPNPKTVRPSTGATVPREVRPAPIANPHESAESAESPAKPQAPKEPTARERLLAEAYGRQLQAIAAPTVVRSGATLNTPQIPTDPPVDSSLLATVAQALRPNTPPSPSANNSSAGANPKETFLTQARSSAGPGQPIPAASEYTIKAGWEIPAILEQDINSDLPGEIKALVTSNVYDTATGKHLLIPQGSRLIGVYNSNIVYGQNSLQVIWRTVIFPDASSIDLGGMVGQDASGTSGFRGDVDNHYKRLIGFTVLSSLFSAGFQLSQTHSGSILRNPSAGETAAGAVGQEVSQLGNEVTRRNLNVQPTIKIPLGYRFNVRVDRDVVFDGPYRHQ